MSRTVRVVRVRVRLHACERVAVVWVALRCDLRVPLPEDGDGHCRVGSAVPVSSARPDHTYVECVRRPIPHSHDGWMGRVLWRAAVLVVVL